MVEHRAATAIEGSDRGDPGRGTGQLMAEMVQYSGRGDLDRVERAAGHLEETDLQSEGQPVERAPTFADESELVLAQREEMLDLERRPARGRDIDDPSGSFGPV